MPRTRLTHAHARERPYAAVPNTFAGYPLIDPAGVRLDRRRFVRGDVPELRYANSYYSLTEYPDIGWILLDRRSYNKINRYATNHQLVISDFVNSALTISNISIVQARCVTRGLQADPNALYLIQVTDNWGVLNNQWFQCPVNAQYNIRTPGYPQQFHSWSLNGGTTWTWNTMIGDLWNRAPSQLGSYPHLPSAPSGTPEDFIFVGVSLYKAIWSTLNYLGMTVVGNYPNHSIVSIGASDSALTTLQTRYKKYLIDDMEYIDGGSGRVPGQVVVFFKRRNSIYGTEETVRYDSLNWQATPAYSVTVSAPSTFSSAVGTGHLWSDFTVRYDEDGSPLAADVTTATAIAQERATQFYNRIFSGTQGCMKQTYSGLLPFTTGSLVSGVKWYNSGYNGWCTEIVRGCLWPEIGEVK